MLPLMIRIHIPNEIIFVFFTSVFLIIMLIPSLVLLADVLCRLGEKNYREDSSLNAALYLSWVNLILSLIILVIISPYLLNAATRANDIFWSFGIFFIYLIPIAIALSTLHHYKKLQGHIANNTETNLDSSIIDN